MVQTPRHCSERELRNPVAVDGKSRGILNDEELTILLFHSSIYHYHEGEIELGLTFPEYEGDEFGQGRGNNEQYPLVS